jgi:hypothetical protein
VGYSGSDSFQYTANNTGGTSAAATVSITVTPQAPVANNSSSTVGYNSTNVPINLNITGGAATSVSMVAGAGPTHGTYAISGTSITYTPTTNYSGADSFTYKAINSGGNSTATVSITINPSLPIANNVSATVAFNSGANPISLNITGGAATSVNVVTGAGPTHGNTAVSGTSITYQPTVGYSGSDSFQYTATNASGTSSAAIVTITVNPTAPIANNSSSTVGYNSINAPINLNITGGAPTSLAVTSGPLHGTYAISGASITYTPTTNYSGSDSFTYTAANGGGTSAAATVSITINPGLPIANNVSATVAYNSTNNPISLSLTGGAATSVTVSTQAGHGTATASGTSISYTPTTGYSGSDSFQYTATNVSGTSSPAIATITVNPTAPIANNVSATIGYNSTNTPITLNITGGTPTSVSVFVQAGHGTATASGTSITYTPTTGYSGSDSFQYKASNAGGTSAAATATITVNPGPPVANNVSATVGYNSTNTPITLNITGGAPSSVSVSTQAGHGTATASGTSITYTPTTGYFGPDSFQYKATNVSGTSAAATATITVNPNSPIANNVSATVNYNSTSNPITLNITGGAATSVAVSTQAGHGTATASGTSITYTPTTGYSGADSFQYTATNAGGTSSPATASITVKPQAPVANNVSATVAFNSTNNPISLNITGGAASSVAVASQAAHGTATASGASITYTPTSGYSGPDSFTYTATNATATSAAATVSVTVSPFSPVTHTYTSGSGATETVPVGAQHVVITVDGGGGGGQCKAGTGGLLGAGGGGAGETVKTIGVTGGNTLTYTVGVGGDATGCPINGSPGGASTVSGSVSGGSVSLTGGSGGGGTTGVGGTAGSGSGGDTNLSGTAGSSTAQGGAGGDSPSSTGAGNGGSGGNAQGGAAPGNAGQVKFAYT